MHPCVTIVCVQSKAGVSCAREMAQQDPRNQVKLWSIVAHTCNLTTGKGWGGGVSGVCWPASLAYCWDPGPARDSVSRYQGLSLMTWGQFLQPKPKGQNTTEVFRPPHHQNSGNPLPLWKMSVTDLCFSDFSSHLKAFHFFLWPKPMELFAWTPVTGVHLTSSWISSGSVSYLRLYRKHFENWAERLTMVVISLTHMTSCSSVWTEPSLMFPLLASYRHMQAQSHGKDCRAGWSRWPPVWLAFGLTFRGNFGFPYITDTGSSRTKEAGSSQHVPL